MKRGFIFSVMLTSVLVFGFAQSALSGTYRYSANAYITFTGNNFSGSWNRTSTMSGSYSVSGNRLTLNITGGTVGRNTWNWTIVDANTLRDHDGDSWRKEGGGSQQPAQPPISWTVNSPSDWIEMVNGIRSAGNNKTHIVTVSGTVSVIPTPSSDNTFGSVTGITVTMQGDGTITPSSNGSLLRIGSGQTVVVKDLALKGRDNNNVSVVNIDGGTFRMEGGASVCDGGGVYVGGRGTFNMQDNASVSGNTGVGVSVYGGTFNMRNNSSVSGNTGGGVSVADNYFNQRGTFNMQDNASVSGNTGVGVSVGRDSEYTGGSYSEGTFTMQDNASVSGNTATAGEGGGVWVSRGTFTMQGSASVSGNTTRENGGGVYVGRGTFTMRNNASVSGNNARISGGGVYVGDSYGVTFTMQDNATVSGNTAGNGGGVYVSDGGTFTMQGGTISGNTAGRNGGGVFVDSGFTKSGGIIYGSNETDTRLRNTASNSGHALYSNGDWRNATAGPTTNHDTFGFWMND